MISIVSGAVLVVERDGAVIDVNGLGLYVGLLSSYAATLSPGDRVLVHTIFSRRQDGVSLSGFTSREELELFSLMTETPGVGAPTARAALAMLGHDGFVDAIRRGNEPMLRKVPGIGPRVAALLLLTLRPRLGVASGEDSPPTAARRGGGAEGKATAALQAIGWNKRDAAEAVEALGSTSPEIVTVEGLIRAALAALGPRR
ncbi:Holliday junction branch migration protein RuvA [Microbacterium sp. P07]|uniref:Holliday junction branch migration protein RuvA n=1 Tax=Microbacterium sp. P07 TaxID=3366952 RepID=UPI003746F0CF